MAHPADVVADAENGPGHIVVADRAAVEDNPHFAVFRVDAVGDNPGAHRLKGVGVFGPPHSAVVALPHPLADIVADGVAEDIVQGVSLGNFFALLADDDDQFALVLKDVVGIAGDDNRVVGADQGVVGAIADVGGGGILGFLAAFGGHFGDVFAEVDAGGVESGGDDRRQQFDGAEGMAGGGFFVAGKGTAGNFANLVLLDNSVGGPVGGLKAAPFHCNVLRFLGVGGRLNSAGLIVPLSRPAVKGECIPPQPSFPRKRESRTVLF